MKNFILGFVLIILSACASPSTQSADRSRESTMASISAEQPAIKRCWNSKKDKTEGRVVATYSVEANGGIHDVKISESSFKDEKFHHCILEALKKTKFDATKDGSTREIVYPFIFKP
ncbi:MAG: TonB family protein [Bdellovibrionota bacterium]